MLKIIIFFIGVLLPVSALADEAQQVFANPNYVKAQAQFDNGDYQSAHRALKQLDEQFPDHPVILNNLGVISARLGDVEQAERLFERAIMINRYTAVGYQNLRKVYMYKAMQNYRKALVLEEQETPLDVQFITVNTQPEKFVDAFDSTQAILESKILETPLVDEEKIASNEKNADPVLVEFITRWASAWSQQDVTAYFSYYIANYQPRASITHTAWREMRTKRITAPRSIMVDISDIRIKKDKNEPGTAEIIFNQSYNASNFRSKVVKKMDVKQTDDGWRITRERVIQRK